MHTIVNIALPFVGFKTPAMLSKVKRPLEDHGSGQGRKKCPTSLSSLDYLRWKIWLLKNYEYASDSSSTAAIPSIINFSLVSASEDKENEQGKFLSTDTLGRLVKEIWKGKTKRVRQGARGRQEYHYLHLAKKGIIDDRTKESASSFSSLFNNLKLPGNWSVIRDKEEVFSFIRVENVETNNHRTVTEVSVTVKNMANGNLEIVSCTLKA